MADTSDTVDVPAPIAPEPQRQSAMMPILGGVVAAVLGFGVAQVVPGIWPSTDVTARLDSQAAEIADLKTQITRLAESGPSAFEADLGRRLTEIEGAPADLSTRIDALGQEIATLSATPITGAPVDPAILAQLRADIDALKSGGISPEGMAQATAAIDAKLASVTLAAEEIAKSATRQAALQQISAALDSGASYQAALTALDGADLPDVIRTNAQSGLPSLHSLQTSFPDAARDALDAALRADQSQGWADRIGTFLRGQTGARSLTPHAGTDPDAVLSRAEAALAAGDLTTAFTELDGLSPEGQAAMAPWRARGQLRIDAAAALLSLTAK